MDKLIYRFNNQGRKISINSKEILGGKGANLAQMAKLGLPVPPGFTISTKICEYFYKNNNKIPKNIIKQTIKEIGVIEKIIMMQANQLSLNPFEMATDKQIQMFDKALGTDRIRKIFSRSFKVKDIQDELINGLDDYNAFSTQYHLYD